MGAPMVAGVDAAPANWLRAALFVAIFCYFWIGLEGLQPPTETREIVAKLGGNVVNQVTTILLVAMAGVFAAKYGKEELALLVTPLLAIVLCWLACTVLISVQPALSAKRFVLAMFITFLAAVFPLLPRDEQQFADLMAAGLALTIALCFVTVALVPTLAIHQAWDVKEPDLAGSWRGVFPHKNAAGTAMAIAVFVAVYVARVRSLAAGAALLVASLVFLYFSKSKTPALMLVPTIALSTLVLFLRNTAVRIVVVLAAIATVNLFTLGSVVFAPIKQIIEKSLSDPSFTNRTDIWEFALQEFWKHPITGFGFHSFWGTEELINSGDSIETWATKAEHAHNSYLDAALNTGLIGLVLVVAWIVVQPMLDLRASERRGGARPLETMYVNIWCYLLLAGALESQFFAGGGPSWFMMLLAIFGLRLQASAELVAPGRSRQLRSTAA